MAVEPVSIWENELAHRLALCAEPHFVETVDQIKQLRDRQAEYLASLPSDPKECLSAALGALHQNGSDHPKGLEEAIVLSFALAPMIKDMMAGCHGPERDALLHVVDRIRSGLECAAAELNHVYAILENPSRIERERWMANRSNGASRNLPMERVV